MESSSQLCSKRKCEDEVNEAKKLKEGEDDERTPVEPDKTLNNESFVNGYTEEGKGIPSETTIGRTRYEFRFLKEAKVGKR